MFNLTGKNTSPISVETSSMHRNEQLDNLLNLIENLGIEGALRKIDIEAIEDLSVRIILRTIDNSIETLINHIKEANSDSLENS
jgi:hypothetical protein